MWHFGRMAHRLAHLLGDVGLGEGLQRDDDLGARLAQDGADLLGLEQRVDRVHDARRRPAEQRRSWSRCSWAGRRRPRPPRRRRASGRGSRPGWSSREACASSASRPCPWARRRSGRTPPAGRETALPCATEARRASSARRGSPRASRPRWNRGRQMWRMSLAGPSQVSRLRQLSRGAGRLRKARAGRDAAAERV